MKLLLIPAIVLGLVGTPAEVRFETEGVRVGSELVTGTSVSLKEAGSLPLLVSGSVVESLSGETLAVSLGDKQFQLGAGLRLARTADGYLLSTHGMPFSLTAGDASLTSERAASFKVTEKGFDFGALGTLDGSLVVARVLTASAPVAAAPQQADPVSPEKAVRQGRRRTNRLIFSAGLNPTITQNAASSWSVRQIPRLTPDGSP